MPDLVGIILLMLVAIAVLAGGGWYLWRRGIAQLPLRREISVPTGVRLEVLESTAVDARRRLILVRCDDVEHLLMTGGPSDLVVEKEVSRRRGAQRSADTMQAERARAESALADFVLPPAAEKLVEPAPEPRPEPRPRSEPKPAEAAAMLPKHVGSPQDPPTPLAAVAGPEKPAREHDAAAPPVPPPRNGAGRPPLPPVAIAGPPASLSGSVVSSRTTESEPGQRRAGGAKPLQSGTARQGRQRLQGQESLAPPARDNAAAQVAKRQPAAAGQSETPRRPALASAPEMQRLKGERANAAAREPIKPITLPVAEVPWPETDSVESEIGKALRSHASAQPAPTTAARPAQRSQASARPATDPTTTLGDLAERLEEALAREVQGASRAAPGTNFELEPFGLAAEPNARANVKSPERSPAPEERKERPAEREERRERPEASKLMAPAADSEARKEARQASERSPERQEEAPVISLSARRREAADPLEDEMARLLGELTGDVNRR